MTQPVKSRKTLYIGVGIIVVLVIVAVVAYSILTAPQPLTFTATLAGSNEVPSVTSTGTGNATVTISADRQTLHFVVFVTGVTNITLAHIHTCTTSCVGTKGPVSVNFYTGPTKSGSFSGRLAQGDVTASMFVGPMQGHTMSDLITAIQNGMAYVNVHSTAHPGGEIRGQLHP